VSLDEVSPCDAILAAWLGRLEEAMQGLYAPREEVRKALAEVVLRVLEVSSFQHGREAFANPELEMGVGLLSTSFGGGMMAIAAVASTIASMSTGGAGGGALYTIPEVANVEAMDEDEDLLLAIKMSQESSGVVVQEPDTPVPTVAEAVPVNTAEAGDSASSQGEAMEVDVSSVPPPPPPPPAPTSSPTSTSAPLHPVSSTAAHALLAPRFLIALTSDKHMQLIAEHWRKSQSVLWLLLEIARLGAPYRAFLLKRETVAQLADTLLGDQCPLNGAVYAQGSRRRAPSSYVTIVPGKDDSLPFIAKNVPDWTHLIELLSALVCSADSLQLAQSLGEVGYQCVQAKTLYNTIFRQARYTAAAIPMIKHLSYENKPLSDLIGESLCDELGQCKEGETAHLFAAMEKFLSINDSLAHARCFQLFGGGDFNLLETMNISKDVAQKQRFVCVFIRSFVALAEQVPIVRTVVGSSPTKITTWAPWMLKFCFRFVNKCGAEQRQFDFPQVSPEKNQVNQAIRAMVGGTQGAETRSVSFQPTPTVCIPTGTGASPPPALAQGPFVRVYGEDVEAEGTPTWLQRAERTSLALHALLLSLGARPDDLIPVDTFDEETPSAVASKASSTGSFAPIAPAAVHPMPLSQQSAPVVHDLTQDTAMAGFHDGMTDEELAQFLANGMLD
jgi:hypothetical protein